MSATSIKLQSASFRDMLKRKPHMRSLAGLDYWVLPGVYKGATDTELLCNAMKVKRGEEVWDIGTGTGFVALWAKKKGAGYVLATDKNPAALKNAKKNSKFLKLKIDVRRADVFGTIKKKFDVITCNPPFTDRAARKNHEMNFWDKGNRAVKNFFKGLAGHLKPDGRALICWSSFGGTRRLKNIAREYNVAGETILHIKNKRSWSHV